VFTPTIEASPEEMTANLLMFHANKIRSEILGVAFQARLDRHPGKDVVNPVSIDRLANLIAQGALVGERLVR